MTVIRGQQMQQTIQDYLNALRDSGRINMMGAGVYLQRDFGLSRYEAKAAVLQWIKTFKQGAK
jgi:hypothetical protein